MADMPSFTYLHFPWQQSNKTTRRQLLSFQGPSMSALSIIMAELLSLQLLLLLVLRQPCNMLLEQLLRLLPDPRVLAILQLQQTR
jgi:hypothetical protein